MITSFLSFTDSNNIAIKSTKILLAISGGLDSVVLAHLFKLNQLDFGLAHCNFNLRGKESDEDEKFVEKLATKLNIEFHTVSFNTTEVAKKKRVSIQMAARELRYGWFEKIRKEFAYDLIATAHHKGDVVETVLFNLAKGCGFFNLAKGCGLEGLHGIRPLMGNIIRPLLFAERHEIELFAKEKEIRWREDSSNKSVKYSRNKIRHQVVPVLQEINSKAQEAIYNTSKRIGEAEAFLEFVVKNAAESIIKKEGINAYISIKLLMVTPGYIYLLFELLKPYNFVYAQIKPIISSFSGIAGKLFYSSTHVLNVDRAELIISPISERGNRLVLDDDDGEYVIDNLNVTVTTYPASNYSIKKDNSVLGLDKDKLTFPLEIRGWQKGDIFYPLGMNGKKKLSDFMIDAKIPVNLKDQIRIVLSEGEIVGILNHRLDRRFKIDEKTKIVFEITCK